MTDDEILGALLRRFLLEPRYNFWGYTGGDLVLHGRIDVSTEELAVLDRVRTVGDEAAKQAVAKSSNGVDLAEVATWMVGNGELSEQARPVVAEALRREINGGG